MCIQQGGAIADECEKYSKPARGHPLAPIRLTNAATQLAYGSGETQGEGVSLHFQVPIEA